MFTGYKYRKLIKSLSLEDALYLFGIDSLIEFVFVRSTEISLPFVKF